jgi:transposase InsO family protein
MQNHPQQPRDIAVWRFGIISPLLHRDADSPPLYAQLDALAKKSFITPEGEEKVFSTDTLRQWLYRYKAFGLDGLANKQRRNRGKTLVPENIQEELLRLRKELPAVTVKRLLERLKDNGLWNGRKPSKTALYRFTAVEGLNRCATNHHNEAVRTFDYPHFGDMWSADFLHGPKVRRGTYTCKSYLCAIIDDATRYVVAAHFHLSETTESFLSDLMLAVRRFGIPRRLYTDNGAAFRSAHLRSVAAKLFIALPHTPPYKPRGRGKIERFFRSVRDGFLSARAPSSLQTLNKDFSEWIMRYHHTPHRILGMSPLNRKLTDTGESLKQIDPAANIQDMFRLQTTKTVGADGCVRLWKIRFEIPDALPGEKITVYYLPWDKNAILVGEDKRKAKALDTVKNAYRFDQPIRGNNNNKAGRKAHE